ncbi:hypothetical protein PHYBOEH_000974 [Phytophthora boehmeriae]|uniref:LamG-like jellyroll fold domain-containing protein n=1 Tax=Phytophthora boehmeriae TaxID=109152 RepID=A0A8T1X0J9_9STRA|nr:hypothetical protein PHYBOEH_000974 [Phytophthora boehmeriae]
MVVPAAACSTLCSYLTGLELFSLSHVDAFWLRHLSAASVWQSRLPPTLPTLEEQSPKCRYTRARSLHFHGLPVDGRSIDSYAFLLPPNATSAGDRIKLTKIARENFSFDLHFALLQTQQDGIHFGGILYGLQSVVAESRQWPQFHQQFVAVSATGDLYCSVIDSRPVIKTELQASRWYHLALTYDRQRQRQQVYLDGELIRCDTGQLHREWEFLTHEQVGTGCITAAGLHFPRPGYLGWYNFHGVIDEFRVWSGVLSEEEVGGLARGEKTLDRPLRGTLSLSGSAPRGSRWNVDAVRCSRPSESRYLQVVKSGGSRGVIMRPEQLPADTIKTLCSYLTGFDAFSLSHTNAWWMRYLADGVLWQKCMRGLVVNDQEVQARAWKQKYMLSRSMLFRGLQKDDERQLDSYAYLKYAGREQHRLSNFHLTYLGSDSFSFDVWFSLLPASDGHYLGGIIFGLQSASRESRQWPHYHQQFVIVSSTGDLHCSVLGSRPVVASNLKTNRWYHLTLTYDNGLQRQDVYLDGVNVRSDTGALHPEWGFLSHEQVGTGCITAGSLDFPRPKYLGWYGFHGMIDEFRIWGEVLCQDDVAELARGGSLRNEKLRASVKRDTAGTPLRNPLVTWVNVKLAICTRPTEGGSMQQREYWSSSQPACVIS